MAEHVRAASIATAMQAVNAIPALCEAGSGIVTMADLPLIRSGRASASFARRSSKFPGLSVRGR